MRMGLCADHRPVGSDLSCPVDAPSGSDLVACDQGQPLALSPGCTPLFPGLRGLCFPALTPRSRLWAVGWQKLLPPGVQLSFSSSASQIC